MSRPANVDAFCCALFAALFVALIELCLLTGCAHRAKLPAQFRASSDDMLYSESPFVNEPPSTPTYSATLFGADGISIGTWKCDAYTDPASPQLWRNGKPVARIHGTYVIVRIE